MKKKILFIILMALLLISLPVFAAYEVEKMPDGSFEVTFTYATVAENVFLIGGFNDWVENDEEMRMTKNAEGVYEITIILAKGTYEYKFFADGGYYSDPTNPDTVGGFGNSLATVTSGGMLGEMAFSGKMVNEFTQEGEDGPVKMNNDLSVKLEGTIQQTIDEDTGEKVDRFNYYTELAADNDMDDLENASSDMDYITLDSVYINQMNLELLGDYVNYSLQTNLKDSTDSYDYLGLVEATTDNENRDHTQNINESGDHRRIKLTPGSNLPEGYDFDVNITEYTSDTSNSSSVKKYYSHLNFKKDFKDPRTGLYKGQVGFSGMTYQPVVAGAEKELAVSGAVFGEYEVAKNLTVRGEYAYVPRGDISERSCGAFDRGDNWLFVFDVSDYPDIEDIKDPYSIEEVHIVGDFKDGADAGNWDPADKGYALEEVEDGRWELLVPKTAIDPGAGYKFLFDADSWNGNEAGDGGLGGDGGDFFVGNNGTDIPLTDGQMYMAEVNYKIFDTMRSFRNGADTYNFDVTAGYEVLENRAYLPLATDNLAANKQLGRNKVYVNSYYYPLTSNDLRLTVDGYYQTAYEDADTDVKESEELSAYSVAPGFDFPEPVPGIEYVKGHVSIGNREGIIDDPYHEPEEGEEQKTIMYDWVDDRHAGFEDIRTIYGEVKTKPVGPFNYFLFNVNNEQNLKVNDDNKFESVSEIFAETELNIPVEQIAYVKGNVDYKLNDETVGEQRQPRYWVETKFHHIPEVENYFTHFLINYESDLDGIIDESIYNDDDNDWQKRIYGETKLVTPEVEDFEVTFSLESQHLEENIYPTVDDLDEELNAKYVAEGKYIDWYTLFTISTGYDFDYGIRADLSVKYDMNHSQVSQYEDDAIKLELSKPLNEYTTIRASYNSKHPDYSSDQFVNLGLETLF